MIAGFLCFISVGFIRQQKHFISTIHQLSESKSLFMTFDDDSEHMLGPPLKKRKTNKVAKTTTLHSCQLYNETLTFPEVPAFIIIGAQKAGSSALADYLKLHPNIVGPNSNREKELHFLDWMIPKKKEARDEKQHEMNISTEEELWCYYRQNYANNFDTELLRRNASLLAFEKTPSYMIHGYYLPEVLKKVCPWNPKLLAILRNPIDRAWSQYNMAKSVGQVFSQSDQKAIGKNNPTTFEELLEKEVASLNLLRLSDAPPLSDNEWDRSKFAVLPNITASELDAAHKKHFRQIFLSNYLQRGMYAIHLQRWKEAFGDNLLVIRYEDLYGPNAQDFYDQVVDHIGVARVPLPILEGKHWSRQKYRLKLSNRTREYLGLFFQPYNDMLAGLLNEKWENSWT
jgi:hypothetical protein